MSFIIRLYFERIGQVEQRLVDVHHGGSPDYLMPLADLEKSIKMRAHIAGVLRELRLNNINNKHESESKGALENHEVRFVSLFMHFIKKKVFILQFHRFHSYYCLGVILFLFEIEMQYAYR